MIKLSKMTGKLEGIAAINDDPSTNPFCMTRYTEGLGICRLCYSQTAVRTNRKTAAPRWQRNGEILAAGPIPHAALPMINAAFIRIHAHGEIRNAAHAENLIRLAERNPHATFAIWTKRIFMLAETINARKEGKPPNLIIVYSNPAIDDPYTIEELRNLNQPKHRYTDKIFNVMTDETDPRINCKDKCINCLACYRKEGPATIYERIRDDKKAETVRTKAIKKEGRNN